MRYILFAPGMSIDFKMVKGLIFAPTATDILEQLPKGMWSLSKGEDLWHVLVETFNRVLESDKLPHEAAANAFLSFKSQSEQYLSPTSLWFF